jgi:probable DNA metabolism protein
MRCKVPKNFLGILKRHSGCTQSVLDRAAGLTRDQLEASTDSAVIEIVKMVSAVLGEAHMMKAFVRLKPMGEKVLHGYMKPEHDVWYPVGRFLARRFPGTLVVLGNNTLSHAFLWDGEELHRSKCGSLASALRELESAFGAEGGADPAKLWDSYYWSQYRPEAKNTPYFRRNVRKKHADAAGLARETDSGGTRLDDFADR